MTVHLSAREVRQRFIKGELSATEILEAYLKQIHAYDGQVGAFLHVLAERAHKQAKQLDAKRAAGEPLGKLAGVPVAIKDNINIHGEITSCSSKFLTNYKAPFDATVIELMEREDALILGKVNLDEFAMGASTEYSALQKTRNPWALDCVPGGSSGGSAAAVAARMAPLALGSDTGGSVRQPGAFCNTIGFKPSYGRVSRYGLVAFGSSFDQIGPLAANVADVGMIMEVLGQHCPKDSTSLPIGAEDYLGQFSGDIKGLRIGVPWAFLDKLSGDARANFDEAIKVIKELGAEIVEVTLDALSYGIPVYYILATAEASTNLARFDGIRYGQRASAAQTLDQVYDLSRDQGFGPEVKRRILLGTYVLSAGYGEAFFRKAQKARAIVTEEFRHAFGECDLVATPTVPQAAFERGAVHDPVQMWLADIYTVGANLGGFPAISVPSGFDSHNKPLGLHLLGPQRSDGLVCKAADAYEKATCYTEILPELIR